MASQGEMASFPIGTTPFLLEMYSARGSSAVQEIPRTPDDAADEEVGRYLPIPLIRGFSLGSDSLKANELWEWKLHCTAVPQGCEVEVLLLSTADFGDLEILQLYCTADFFQTWKYSLYSYLLYRKLFGGLEVFLLFTAKNFQILPTPVI